MCENFVLNNGRIIPDKDIFNSDGGDFGKKNASKSIRDGGVEADERERGMERVVLVKLDLEGLR